MRLKPEDSGSSLMLYETISNKVRPIVSIFSAFERRNTNSNKEYEGKVELPPQGSGPEAATRGDDLEFPA